MTPSDIAAIQPFASSSPPPQPLMSPKKAVIVDVPPANQSTLPSVTASATAPETSASGPTASVDDSAPSSPLTDIDSDSGLSGSKSDTTKIGRPSGVARIKFPVLFEEWGPKKLAEVQLSLQDQAHIKKLTQTHLDSRASFKMQRKAKLATFYRLMAEKFPILKSYAKHWATVRLLQAHLKVKRSSHKHTVTQEAFHAVNSAIDGAAPRRRLRRNH
ncbi:hypothetical protein DFH09DRAFT_1081827 [Mycena vulgaris]|nr:hypothetical protein DFH09DRAFT_1081827 [Mycena vulgaris]